MDTGMRSRSWKRVCRVGTMEREIPVRPATYHDLFFTDDVVDDLLDMGQMRL